MTNKKLIEVNVSYPVKCYGCQADINLTGPAWISSYKVALQVSDDPCHSIPYICQSCRLDANILRSARADMEYYFLHPQCFRVASYEQPPL